MHTRYFAIACLPYKSPLHSLTTGERGKNSKHGRLALVEAEPGQFHTMENVQAAELDNEDQLVTVFENGKVLVNYDLDSIRQRAQVLLGIPHVAV
jgi:hypothetical protein